MQLPLFKPESNWQPTPVSQLPSWQGCKRVGIDIETYDPHLKKLGPSVRKGGYIAGVSFALEDGPAHYLPMRHQGGDNLPPDQVLAYLKDQAQAYTGTIVGANFNYDLDYLAQAGITYPSIEWQRDIQIADPLIDELHLSYSLDNVAKRWGFPGKNEDLLRQACKDYGIKKHEMYKLPARYVGPYAIDDAVLPLQILRKQERVIDDYDLWDIYNLESQVQPVLLKMRRRGVRIDTDALDRMEEWSIAETEKCLATVRHSTGVHIDLADLMKKDPIVKALTSIGVALKETPTGQKQVDKELLKGIDHPVADAILRARQVNNLRTTFVASIRNHLIGDRIHCTFNQLRVTREDGELKGARFRTSATHPNLQQQPIRGEHAKMWRTIYVPDHPQQQWACLDYSQQEPRMLTHFAELIGLPGARAAANEYRNNPKADNHQMMADLTGLPRTPAKDIFLGLCYGMGGAKLAHSVGLPTAWVRTYDGSSREVAGPEAQAMLDTFKERVPYVHGLAQECQAVARKRGYLITILGRHCHFPKDAKGGYDWTHKALNYLIQPSSADQTKKAMVEIDRAGLPLQLQVHDEVDSSIDNIAQAQDMAEIMRNCVPLRVPSRVDIEVGPSWGELEKVK